MVGAALLWTVMAGVAGAQATGDPITPLIDHHLEARWKELGTTPAAPADDAVFIRRVALDVLGRVPTPEEMATFLGDRVPDKRAQLVDRWLATEEAGEYFVDRWIRLLFNYHFEQTDPAKVDFPAFGDWLKRAWMDDLPYDQFASRLLAARGEKDEKPEANFILRHLDPKEPPTELAVRTGRIFLGIQLQCAQCHDHPSQKWTQEDFWGLTAFFGGLKPKTRATFSGVRTKLVQEIPTVRMPLGDDRHAEVTPRFIDGRAPDKDEAAGPALARLLLDAPGGQFAKAAVNRMWAHYMGRGFVEPVDSFSEKNAPSHPELLDELAREFVRGGYRQRRVARAILLSRAYGLSSRRVAGAPENSFAFKLLKAQDPPQFLNNLVGLLNLDVFLDEFYKNFAGNKDLPESYKNRRVFRLYLFSFVQAILAPSGRAPEEMPYAGSIRLALKLMNGKDLQNLVKAHWGNLAEILKRDSDPAARLERIFLCVLGRPPDAAEQGRYIDYLKRKRNSASGYEDVYWTLLNSSEFFFNH